MIDFIYKLNDVLPGWPSHAKWSLRQIADATDTSVPHVLHYLSEGLGREIDVAGAITLDEATEALLFLSKRIRPQIEERERELEQLRQQALRNWEKLQVKVRDMLIRKEWRTAYRTLCYFAGQNENRLPKDTLITLYGEVIRLGAKAEANMQELTQSLQKAVALALSYHSQEGIETALDLVDAYGEFFLADQTGKGPLVIGNILAVLEEPAARYELWGEYKSLVDLLYPAPST